MQKKSKKRIIWIVTLFLVLIISVNLINKIDFLATKEYLKRKLDPKPFAILQVFGDIERSSKKLNNDYNVKFLPETQFVDLNFKKIKLKDYFANSDTAGYANHLKIKVRQVFYIDNYLDNIVFLTSNGEIFFNKFDSVVSNKKLESINTNLNLTTGLDLLIDENKIYISGVVVEDKCAYLKVFKAEFSDIRNLNFNTIFNSNECVTMIQSGRLGKSKDNSLFLTTAADVLINKNEMDDKPQSNNSIFGKILKINLDTNDYEIFSKGHRNILGLYIDESIILATENGPRGGDEINKIILGENYGWPNVSYGQKYVGDEYYPNSHSELGFKEPIYAFIPSVGISQITKVGDNFSEKWKDNFLVASLNGNHIYRVKFDKNFEKVFFIEGIFIGERMRDLVYMKEKNVFLIALENSGSLGILEP